jgi:hypothetical protein
MHTGIVCWYLDAVWKAHGILTLDWVLGRAGVDWILGCEGVDWILGCRSVDWILELTGVE